MPCSFRVILTSLTMLLALLAGGCFERDSKREKPVYVATTGQIGEMVRAIVGDRAEVVTLIGPGLDPHGYAPTNDDMRSMVGAKAIFHNGLHLEGRLRGVIDQADKAGIRTMAIGEMVSESVLRRVPGNESFFDPHLWMDPIAWLDAIRVTRDAIIKLDPAGRDEYLANAQAYSDRIKSVHEEIEAELSKIPDHRRIVVTTHASIGYFADRYGLQAESLRGINSQSRAGLDRVERLISLLVEQDIPAIFDENGASTQGVRSVIEGAGRRGHKVALGGTIYVDAMGEPCTPQGTYDGMMLHNALVITKALTGDASFSRDDRSGN